MIASLSSPIKWYSNHRSNALGMILRFAIALLLLPSAAQGGCVENHELNEETGLCDWTGPQDACVKLVDFWNRSWFMPFPNFPNRTFIEVNLKVIDHFMDENAVKVVVRRGCMFTGYAYDAPQNVAHQIKLGQNLGYGVHALPNLILRNLPHDNHLGSLTRAQCFCDPTEATVNGHVPAPPPDRKCIEHHEFNETTQQCEWTKELKFCAELHSNDTRRMLLEMPKWPEGKKYDQNHWRDMHAQNFHISVTHIVVRQHCFATLYWWNYQWMTLPTIGYGYHKVATSWASPPMAGPSYATAIFVCECIK